MARQAVIGLSGAKVVIKLNRRKHVASGSRLVRACICDDYSPDSLVLKEFKNDFPMLADRPKMFSLRANERKEQKRIFAMSDEMGAARSPSSSVKAKCFSQGPMIDQKRSARRSTKGAKQKGFPRCAKNDFFFLHFDERR